MYHTEFAAYCLKMAKTAAWGGQVELLALSRVLNRPIEVSAGGDRQGIISLCSGHTSRGSLNCDGRGGEGTVGSAAHIPQTHVWTGRTL